MSQKYYQLQQETIDKFNVVVTQLAFPTKINFKIIGDIKQKKLIAIKKIPDAYAYVSGFDILVTFNEPLFEKMEDDQIAIELLIVDELNNIQINMESGVIKLGKPNFITSTQVMEKYTPEEVKRVKDLERLTLEQAKEDEKEAAAANATY